WPLALRMRLNLSMPGAHPASRWPNSPRFPALHPEERQADFHVHPAFTDGFLKTRAMRLPVACLLAALPAVPAFAADSPRLACLSKDAQRDALASHQAVPLAQAIHLIRPKYKGDVVRARLCRGPNGLVYMLTLLSRSGKVTRATVDAVNGTVVGGG